MFTNQPFKAYDNGIKVNPDRVIIKNNKDINYEVICSKDIFDVNHSLVADICKEKSLAIFVSPTINRLYGEKIQRYFQHNRASFSSFTINPINTTEQNKNFENILKICDYTKTGRFDRNGIMIGVGGGIINDLVGFAASIYKRGVNYIRINTTLLGQIDVAVGVKTGINIKNSKNFLGSYYPPIAAINDIKFLRTLDLPEIQCGLSEIIKMGIICDKLLFETLELNYPKFLKNDFEHKDGYEVLARAKLRMIEELYPNLFEKDLKRLVDFGHSFSPRIETASNYEIKHGFAVAIDMAISSYIGVLLDILSEEDYYRIIKLLVNIGLPIFDEQTCTEKLLMEAVEEMYLHRGKKINVVIPCAIGQATFITSKRELTGSLLKQVIHDLRKTSFSMRPSYMNCVN